MLSEIFYWLFNMSIAASITGVFLSVLRLIKKIPRKIIVILWAIPFIRMFFPIGISGKYGLMSLISNFTTKTVTLFKGPGDTTVTMMNHVMAAETYFPITYKVNILGNIFNVASFVWLTVALALILTLLSNYISTKHELRDSKHLRDNIYLSDKITSPAVYGIFRPRIILPHTYENAKELPFVLMHEEKHIRRLDNLWRIMAFIVVALHWFNPLAWLFLRCFLVDAEIACDESVLSECGKENQKNYALALVNCAKSKNLFISAFGGAKLRVRIDHILSYKKMSALSAVGFGALAIVIAYALLTNAAL